MWQRAGGLSGRPSHEIIVVVVVAVAVAVAVVVATAGVDCC